MNINLRDQLIFGEQYNPAAYRNGLRYFKALRRRKLRLLMDKHIFDPYPWTKYMEYVWFMEIYGGNNELYLHGFVYGPDRKDGFDRRQGGISIEGIGRDRKWNQDDNEQEAKMVFKFLFGNADQFRLDLPYAWYD